MDLYTKKLLKNFRNKRPLYEDFCLALNNSLATLLDKNKYKYQIYYRVKSLERLEEKITRKRKHRKIYEKIVDIEDLAGIRVIFYLESDKEKFVKDLKESLYHLKSVRKVKKKNGYHARHVIMSFGDELAKCREFKNFKNLKCEVQLVSMIDHAFAELEHDWIYKDVNNLKDKNPKKYKILKKIMGSIFKNYIEKINLKFEKAYKQLSPN